MDPLTNQDVGLSDAASLATADLLSGAMPPAVGAELDSAGLDALMARFASLFGHETEKTFRYSRRGRWQVTVWDPRLPKRHPDYYLSAFGDSLSSALHALIAEFET